jgi:hypothetical protein
MCLQSKTTLSSLLLREKSDADSHPPNSCLELVLAYLLSRTLLVHKQQMKSVGAHRVPIIPRLLARAEAAASCGVSVPIFSAQCPIRPVALGTGKRLERYDVRALDQWIDALSNGASSSTKNWLAALEPEYDDPPRKGN